MEIKNPIIIFDFGSQYTQLITRRCRELGYYSIIRNPETALEDLKEYEPSAVILSGGPSSVYDSGAPDIDDSFFEKTLAGKVPVLGICYGLQLMMQKLGGKVEASGNREYGRAKISFKKNEILPESVVNVWMSHGDDTRSLPEGFEVLAKTEGGVIAAVANSSLAYYGLQFHPEVHHTDHGIEILRNFFENVAKLKKNWNMGIALEQEVEAIRNQIGPDDHAICALSGGVDSTVAAVLVHKAIGDRLHCIFVDHGMMRFKERERVEKMYKDNLHLPVAIVDASDTFLEKIKGVIDPEQKRKLIGEQFIRTFERFGEELEKKLGKHPKFLVQGTLYPDVIESSITSGTGAKSTHATTIKTHHNVGGLPKDLKYELVEPLRELFKDEVRRLGVVAEVPETFLKRHPFPGPGLAIRILGEITRPTLDTLRLADEIFISELHHFGIYDEIWQAFAVFLPVKSVGVQGDGRTHDNVVALRAVTSVDGMTSDWYPFTHEFLSKVSNRICNEVKGVNRVVYDVSSKPPATIEWE